MNNYRLKKEKERLFFSSLMVFAGIAIFVLISFIFNLLKFEDFTDYTGPVKITFGTPDGVDDSSLITDPVEESIDEPEPEVKEAIDPIEPTEEVEPVKEVIPEEVVKETVKPTPVPEIKDIVKPIPVTPVTPPEPLVQKGRESGNSHETSFETSSSKIGRRAYFPISQFMPLPKSIPVNVYALIDGDITNMGETDYNRKTIDKYYWKTGSNYSLNESIPLQNRPEIWAILEKAQFDVDNADYKNGRNLKNVIIVFEINSNTNGRNSIKSAKIESSSGDKLIDEAVLYGFKQSTYSNSTNDSVKGRFKYTFNNP